MKPVKTKASRCGRRYPWDEWFMRSMMSDSWIEFRRGIEFDCMTHSFTQMLRSAANEDSRRHKIEVHMTSDLVRMKVVGSMGPRIPRRPAEQTRGKS